MNGYLLTANLLVFSAVAAALRGWGRRKIWHTSVLITVGGLMTVLGEDPPVLVCAVTMLMAGAMLLIEMTAARRSLLAVGWQAAAAALIAFNVWQEEAGSWIRHMKPWVTVSAMALIGALAAAAVATARMARDPDVGPGGV